MCVRLTVKNYRCFDDRQPLRLELDRGFTAFVGPNNAGKSSALRLFYELRPVWEAVRSQLGHVAAGLSVGHFGYPGVLDYEELFSDTNSRPLSVELEIGNPHEPKQGEQNRHLTKIIGICERENAGLWHFQCFADHENVPLPNSHRPYEVVKVAERTLISLENGSKVDCSSLHQVASLFCNALYIGPFRNAINEGAGNYFDLSIGSSFIATWHNWKTGESKAYNRAIQRVTEDIRHIFEFERLEINASEHLKTLNLFINGKPYRLPELGAGLAQFIVVFGNAAIRQPSLILIDEPELNLHPSLQIDFLTSLAAYATEGMVFATHSIGLARAVAERIYSFQRQRDTTLVKPFEQTLNYSEFLGEMSFSTFKELGCDRILLVEGVTDVKTIQQFLRKRRKDHTIVVLPLGGDQLAKGNMEAELGELKRLSGRIAALVDSERKSAEDRPAPQREAFAETCQKLGFYFCVTERRALENYFTDHGVKAAFGDSFRALGPYEHHKNCEKPWEKSQSWRIARVMDFEDIRDTDLGRFLDAL